MHSLKDKWFLLISTSLLSTGQCVGVFSGFNTCLLDSE